MYLAPSSNMVFNRSSGILCFSCFPNRVDGKVPITLGMLKNFVFVVGSSKMNFLMVDIIRCVIPSGSTWIKVVPMIFVLKSMLFNMWWNKLDYEAVANWVTYLLPSFVIVTLSKAALCDSVSSCTVTFLAKSSMF